MDPNQLRTVPDVATAVAADLADAIVTAVRERGRAVLCLSGGGTPLPAYRALAGRHDLPWRHVWIAWGDERNVPPEHEDRNERAAREALLDHVAVPDDQVLAWPWVPDADPLDAAEAYAHDLRRTLGDPRSAPWFDVTLLGLGEDAHTASLFPGSGATQAEGDATAVRTGGPSSTARLTLTPRALSSSRKVWFLMSGEAKRDALLATLRGGDPEQVPAAAITAWDELRVYTDLTL